MDTYSLIIRLVVASALGIAIGAEREYRAKEAGIRTHFLVSLGSALFMVVSEYAFYGMGLRYDPSRIAAQVVSGIGFIGAGTIIIQKQNVRGLTTAAGLWTTAGIGMAIGSGMYSIGIAAAALVLAAFELLNWIVREISVTKRTVKFLTQDKDFIRKLTESGILDKEGSSLSMDPYDKGGYIVTMVMKTRGSKRSEKLAAFMAKYPDITILHVE